MKPRIDEEIDSLLRRQARHDVALSSQEIADGAHLDADELNSYAENALPTASRARLSAHLADCDQCRRNLIAIAANFLHEEEKSRVVASEATPVGSWRTRFAALFSTRPALRYGVPALLALLIVGMIFIATHKPREEQTLIAQNESRQLRTDTAENTSRTIQEVAPAQTTIKDASRANRAEEKIVTDNKVSETNPARQPKANITPNRTVSSPPSAAASKTSNNAPTEQQTARSDINNSASAPQVNASRNNTAVAQQDESAQAQNLEELKVEAAKGRNRAAGVAGTAAKKDAEREETDKIAPAGRVTTQMAARPEGESRKMAAPTKSERRAVTAGRGSNEEKRAVAGHRFRRQGSVWVDAAYNSSLPLINVTRGSEQFRTLIADEPDIGLISNQLGGEIIIVAKNRAYRIK
jgi:hypothetical protein